METFLDNVWMKNPVSRYWEDDAELEAKGSGFSMEHL